MIGEIGVAHVMGDLGSMYLHQRGLAQHAQTGVCS
jgi:hypothetical protein